MKTTIFALAILISIAIPMATLLFKLFGIDGMYGTFWKQFSPTAYIATVQLVQITISLLISIFLVKRYSFSKRIPSPVAGKFLIWIGGLLLIAPGILRIFTSMIPGGGASFAMMSLAAPVVLVAKPLFYIGVVLLLLAIKPHAKYSYPE